MGSAKVDEKDHENREETAGYDIREGRSMHILRFIPIMLAWLPHVVAGIVMIESVVGKSTNGREKKALVLEYLKATAGKLHLTWGDTAITALSMLIDSVVLIMNIVGGFKHKDQEDPEVSEARDSLPSNAYLVNIKTVGEDPELQNFVDKMRAK